jgi:polyhydroxybutyrate depolymerase
MKTFGRILLMSLCLPIILVGIIWFVTRQANDSLESDGAKRRYMLYVPKSYDPATPASLVISLHGFSDWPAHQMHMSGWNELADEEGFIVVYPLGTGFPLRWQLYDFDHPSANPTADIRFIAELIEHLEQKYNIDPSRVYANGFSNGGGMAHALSCALSGQIAAFGGVSGAYFYPLTACRTTRAVPAILFHGTADAVVPYAGGPTQRFPYDFVNLPDFARELATRNGCTATPRTEQISQKVHSITYTACVNNADVVFYSIAGGGHSWAGGRAMPRIIAGETNTEVNATRLMWDFFQNHPLVEDH